MGNDYIIPSVVYAAINTVAEFMVRAAQDHEE
jgi:hypothetical protein